MKLFNILCFNNAVQFSKIHTYISKIIQYTGPMSINNFMREILTNKDGGYYLQKHILGERGDFVTSPEISQMFGELCGVWIVNEWINQNETVPFRIVELGPGTGALMADALTAISKYPKLFNNLTLNFVEISPYFKKCQEDSLEQCFRKLGKDISVQWWDDFNNVPPEMPTCYLANEFFDATPVHKFKKNNENKWREILVDFKDRRDKNNFQFIVANTDTKGTLAFKSILDKNQSQTDFEFSPLTMSILENIGQRIIDFGGFSLICDYGHNGEKRDTFRAFKGHRLVDPLQNLGECDLTADVDFWTIKDILQSKFKDRLIINGPIFQNLFLTNMAIDLRLEILLTKCKSTEEANTLQRGYRIMMDFKEMGERFKFLSLFPSYTYNMKYVDSYLSSGFRPI